MNLDEAMQTFLEDQGSPNTSRTYSCGLRRFIDWSASKGQHVQSLEDFDPRKAIPFARSLKREGLSFRTIGSYLVAIKQFLFWLKRERKSDVSAESLMELSEQIKDWNRKNKANPLPRLPKEDAVQSALETAHETDVPDERLHLYHLRNLALIETLASTACRISEASSLKRDDLVPEQMGAWVREGKGRKDRMIFWDSEDSWNTVLTYLQERDKLGYEVIGQETLFARHDYGADKRKQILPLTANSMRWALNRLQTGGHFTPHQLRHRAATNLLRKTGNLEMVKDYLGHADIGTTANTYTHLDNNDLIKALRGG